MFLLNLQGKTPIYEQIQDQVLRFIRAGVLKEGDRLPSVRQLAQENGINPNTVAKAYAELEKTGMVYNIPKKGVYVAAVDASAPRRSKLESVITALKNDGYEKEEILSAAERIFGEVKHAED